MDKELKEYVEKFEKERKELEMIIMALKGQIAIIEMKEDKE